MSYFKTYFKFNKNLANQIFGEVYMKKKFGNSNLYRNIAIYL